MKKSFALALFAAALCGFAIGGLVVYQLGIKVVINQTTVSEVTEAAITVHALEQLRTGHLNDAIELLEARLDGSLISIYSFLPQAPIAEIDSNIMRSLRVAREYRAQFPRKSTHAEVDEAVSKALELSK